jgi:eukaryotic-like serine/threonine-protein kinase
VPSTARVHRAVLHRKAGMTHTGQFQYDEALAAYARAEATLGLRDSELASARGAPEAAEEDAAAWREWAQIQIARLSVYYFTHRIEEATSLLAATRPVIERYASPAQRARFFNRLTGIGYQRDRYVISDETLAHSRASLAAAEESGDPAEEALARFLLGLTLLWRGELDEARERLLAALELAERIGDLWIQTVCTTYLGVLHRKRGQVAEVCRYAPQALTLATRGAMPQYVGWARANQAWVAWREGDLEEAAVNGRAALEAWRQLPITWMFQWGARWPLLGVALAAGRVTEAIEQAQALLAPEQHRMPDVLAEACGAAVQAWEADETGAAAVRLREAAEWARQTGYL